MFAALAASIKDILPSQSTCFKDSKSSGRLVDASITAVIPLKQGGNVSGFVKSPYTNSTPHSFKKLAFRKLRTIQRTG